MKIKSSKLRICGFLAAYFGVFGVLALLAYYMADRAGIVNHRAQAPQKFITDLTYYDLPRMTVALTSSTGETHVRLDISLEVAKKDIPMVQGYQPHMIDRLNSFFITVDPDRIQKTINMPWLHSEMLKQVNSVGAPAPVHDVFLRQMLIM